MAMIGLIGGSAADFNAWLAQPLNAILMSAFMLISYKHTKIGIQVILEDYVHAEGAKTISLVLLELAYWGAVIVTMFSILKIAYAGLPA